MRNYTQSRCDNNNLLKIFQITKSNNMCINNDAHGEQKKKKTTYLRLITRLKI